jgi:hypothetical protein
LSAFSWADIRTVARVVDFVNFLPPLPAASAGTAGWPPGPGGKTAGSRSDVVVVATSGAVGKYEIFSGVERGTIQVPIHAVVRCSVAA